MADDLEAQVKWLLHAVRGNGKEGLMQRQARVEALLFDDPATGEPGLARNVRDLGKNVHKLEEHANSIRSSLGTLNWLIRFVGLGGLATIAAYFIGG